LPITATDQVVLSVISHYIDPTCSMSSTSVRTWLWCNFGSLIVLTKCRNVFTTYKHQECMPQPRRTRTEMLMVNIRHDT